MSHTQHQQHHKRYEHADKHGYKHGEKKCYEEKEKHYRERRVRYRGLQLDFEVPLVPEQEILDNGLPTPGKPLDPITSKLWLSFSPDLKYADYKLWVYNAHGLKNINEKITQAHLHLGRSFVNGPIVADLYHGAELNQEGKPVNGLLSEGRLTNDKIQAKVHGAERVSNINSLFDAVRRGSIYANVHGSNVDVNLPGFGAGIARGQIYANSTTA